MITRRDMQILSQWTPDGYPVVSLYLDVSGSDVRSYDIADRAATLIQGAVAELERGPLDAAATASATADLERIKDYLRHRFERNGWRGLALFACSRRDYFRAFPLADAVRNHLAIAPHPYIRPLVLYLEQDPRCAVMMVDRTRAHYFLIEQGEVVEEKEWNDEVPGRIRPGSWYGLADKRIERHVDDHIRRHFLRVAAVLDAQVRLKEAQRVILGGTQDVLDGFRRTLSRRVRERLVEGVIPEVPKPLTAAYVQDHVRSLLRAAEREQNQALMQSVLDAAGQHGYGVVGVEATLAALYQGTVQTLVVDRELFLPGYVCARCQRPYVQPGAEAPVCPACGGTEAFPVHDVIEEAVDLALADGGDVTFVQSSAEWALRGGIGGALRFLPVGVLSGAAA